MAKAKVKSKSEPQASLNSGILARDTTVAALLGLFAFLLYAQTISYGYALDDLAVLKSNNFVHEGFGGFGKILSTFYWQGNDQFATQNSGLFRPASLLLFATEWELFGDKTSAFHFVHILLYAFVAAQLYLWLREMLGKEGKKIALFATIIWIALPVHTEVVANLKSADELLSLLFSLIGFRMLLRWSNSGSMLSLILGAISFFFALLSKEAAVLTIPLALLMLYMFREKKIKDLLVPAGILLGISLIWLFWHQAVISNSGFERIEYDYRHNALLSNDSAVDQFGTALGLQARYWIKMLFGYPLSYNYSFNEIPVNGFADIWPWLSLTGIGAATYFALRKFRSQQIVSFSIIFYFVTIILTSNLFFKIGDIFADRFTFVPSIGFCLLLAFLILGLTKSGTQAGSAATIIVLVIGLVYSIRTISRSSDWSTEETLFIADAENAPNSGRVHDNVGALKMNAALGSTDQNQKMALFEEAFQQYSIAFEIDNKDFMAASALGQILYHKNDYKSSVMWSERSISIRRQLIIEQGDSIVDDWNTLQNTGDAFVRLENYDSAYYYYAASSKSFPRADAFQRMGDAKLRAKDTTAALTEYARSVAFDSTFTQGWDKIANLSGMRGDFRTSNTAFEHLARMNPNDPNPWRMMYTNYNFMGDTVTAALMAKEYYKRGGK